MARKSSNLPVCNFVFVRKAIVAASAAAGIVRDLAASAEFFAKDREAKLQAFYETVAAGLIASMRAQGSHASYAEDSDKLIAATVASVRKVYEDKTQEHLDKAERKALATGRTYGSRNFAAAGIEHPYPRGKKGTGVKAAKKAKGDKSATPPKASAKVEATPENIKAPANANAAWLATLTAFGLQRSKGAVAKEGAAERQLHATLTAALADYVKATTPETKPAKPAK